MKKQIAFLFGAGAEGKGQLNLPSGAEFKRDVILSVGVKKMFYLINKEERDFIDASTLLHHNASSVLYQTIIEKNPKFKFNDDKDEKIVNAYLDYKKSGEAKPTNISEKFIGLYYKKFYKPIKDEEDNNNIKLFLEDISFSSFADSYFNFLRLPKQYRKEVARVMKIYFSAFLSVLNGIIDVEKDILSKMKEDDYIHNRVLLEEKIVEFQEKKIKKVIDDANNDIYYYKIRQWYKNIKEKDPSFNLKVITSNYTNFAEKIIELKVDDIFYIHGKLNLFEDLETKEIKNIKYFKEEKDVIFPFIMAQSGVKPIISRTQIKQWYYASRAIMESDRLILLGYGINTEDEHITNLLRERLKNKKVDICIFDEGDFEDKKTKIIDLLKPFEEKLTFFKHSSLDRILKEIN